MISPALPPALAAALQARLEGRSQREARVRAQAMSQAYRDGSGSTGIRTDVDALAYALTRMPATYAAVAACLDALRDVLPDFAPQTLLDCGAGPGTASWAAAQCFESLTELIALDANLALRALALDLATETAVPLLYESGELTTSLPAMPPAELVIASYVLNEFDLQAQTRLADLLWQRTGSVLLLVEPGTPTGYRNIVAARAHLIARGAHVVAPCPHDKACPLTAPDWCHFSQRLPRSKAHRMLKGADAPFEDERFSYVALSRGAVPARPARVLAQPLIAKSAVTAKLCTSGGLQLVSAPRRDKPAYAQMRGWRWGNGVAPPIVVND